MNDHTSQQTEATARNRVCHLCDMPGTFNDAAEMAHIRAVVREFAHETFTVWRCANCHSLHCLEDIDYGRYYANYPLKAHVLDFPTRRAYAKRLRFLKRLGLRRKHSVLDHGCGGGAFVRYLREKGYSRACGYDPFCEEFSDCAVLKQSYDFVTSYEVIEHSDDVPEYFTKLRRLLHCHGTLVIGTPRADAIDLSDVRTYGIPLHQPHHRHILSFASLERLGTLHGLRIARMYRRFNFDSMWPCLNWTFLKEYVYRSGGVIDVLFEPPRFRMVLSSPRMVLLALFGYFFPSKENMVVAFRRASTETSNTDAGSAAV
jgi:2-polyprenyl-3-methyl-5-hydroxy-6-metoxy-1,4-benzoquinol methylase